MELQKARERTRLIDLAAKTGKGAKKDAGKASGTTTPQPNILSQLDSISLHAESDIRAANTPRSDYEKKGPYTH